MKMPVWARRISVSVGVMVMMYVSVCAYMWATQLDHIFEPELHLQTTPNRLGMQFEVLRIPVGRGADQGELYAWWIPAEKTNVPTLLYLHGNHRNIGNNLEHTHRLHRLGFNVLSVDYRGYGKSSGGKPNETKVHEDAEAAWQYLIKQRSIQPQQIFIYGHSLGGAIAIDLALHHSKAAGLIIESTFTSMAEMGKLSYPFLPISWLLNQRFESQEKISRLNIPLLLIHGTWDKRVPVSMAKKLYSLAPQPKTLLLIEGGEHNNSGAVGWVEYSDALSTFMQDIK